MNYAPTRNIKRDSIAKESVIDKNKGTLAGFIGYWLYRLTNLFKRSYPKANPQFIKICSMIPLRRGELYRNYLGTPCIDFYLDGAHLTLGYDKGYLLLRLIGSRQCVDKSMIFNPTPKGFQEILGVINSMQISLNDKIKKAL